MTTINDSYAEDAKAIEMIQQLAINATACLGYELKKGLLYYKSKLYIGNKGDLRDKLLQQYHDFALGGHSEIQPTYASLKRHFFLLGLLSSVTSWIQHCDVCTRCKSGYSAPARLLQPLPIPKQAWQHISTDFIEQLPKSSGKDVILVVICRMTKYSNFFALSHPFTAASVAKAF